MNLEKTSTLENPDRVLSPSDNELPREKVVEKPKHPYKGKLIDTFV
jgi:hypothetical protein